MEPIILKNNKIPTHPF